MVELMRRALEREAGVREVWERREEADTKVLIVEMEKEEDWKELMEKD